jgi:hypothetical protein
LQIPGPEQRQKILRAEKIKIHEVLMRPETKYKVGFMTLNKGIAKWLAASGRKVLLEKAI